MENSRCDEFKIQGLNNLNRWLCENTDCETSSLYDGLFVIGTCGDCEHWERYPLTGKCNIRSEYEIWKEDDGCIKWKDKEKS